MVCFMPGVSGAAAAPRKKTRTRASVAAPRPVIGIGSSGARAYREAETFRRESRIRGHPRVCRKEARMTPRRIPRVFLALTAIALAARAATAAPQPPKLRLAATADPAGYAVELTIDPARATFHGSVEIDVRFREKTGLLWLNATALKIEKASVSGAGKPASVRIVPGGEDFV